MYSRKRQITNSSVSTSKGTMIKIPESYPLSEDWESKCRKTFDNGHNFHINSLSHSPDGEHFLSSDDLRVNIWNIESNKIAYSIIDMKPPGVDELGEVITHSEFHPTCQDMILTSSSKGATHIVDVRSNSSYEKALKLEINLDPA